jgi:chromosomal replication initiation ATPase DnaA
MTTAQRTALRARTYTHGEMLAFAQFYHEHRTENTPENLLAAFFKVKQAEGEFTLQQRRLMAIEEAVCGYYGQTLQDVRGKRRYTELVRCRQVIAHFAVLHASQHKAADCLGTDRNNIQYAKSKCSELMEVEPLLRREVAEIAKRLETPFAAIDKICKEAINKQTNEDGQTSPAAN